MQHRPLLIPAANPGPLTGPRGNNTWLLLGAEPTLIDAGVGQPEHLDAIAHALGGRDLARVLVTHGHADHASGAEALRRRWPGVDCLKLTTDEPSSWTSLTNGQRLQAGNETLTVIHTPGHALDHVCFWNDSTRELFAGDMVTLGTTVMIPGGRGGGMRAYLQSLVRIQALDPVRIYPGHGTVIEQPVVLLGQYLEHRRMREAQVRGLLAEGVREPWAIVERLYPGLDAGLARAACATIEAHIEKLREDGL